MTKGNSIAQLKALSEINLFFEIYKTIKVNIKITIFDNFVNQQLIKLKPKSSDTSLFPV
jgi:hypothetical protein